MTTVGVTTIGVSAGCGRYRGSGRADGGGNGGPARGGMARRATPGEENVRGAAIGGGGGLTNVDGGEGRAIDTGGGL